MAQFSGQSEGRANFQVGRAFYRPASQVVRDLGVLAAAIYKAETGNLRVMDAMAGCGVRALRYWLEGGAEWVLVNDANPDLQATLKQNLSQVIVADQGRVTNLDANRLFFESYCRQDYYDLVDVDSFGSPASSLSTVLWATKIGGLAYLTSTDGRTATGHLPENSLRVYGAFARCHPAAHEQALRLMIGTIQQQAATKELGVEPVFSFYTGSSFRVMVRLIAKPILSAKNYGFLGYCHRCSEYQTIDWRKLGQASCDCKNPLTLSGPLWLGKLHNCLWLEQMQGLAQRWGWQDRVKLLEVMASEADFPPYFYTLGAIGRQGKMDIPKKRYLIEALQQHGYRATATHINEQAIKTNADLATCITVGRSLSSQAC